MADEDGQGYTVILATFVVAYVLAVLPLPHWLADGRPEWVALVLIYWCIALPQGVGMGTGVVVGLGLDVLEGAGLGQNALSLLFVALLSVLLYQRLRVYSLWQQSAVVFVLVGIKQLLGQWVQNLEGGSAQSLLFLLPALTSALLWPVALHVLRQLRRQYRVT